MKQMNEKPKEKNYRMHVGVMDMEKAYDRINREDLPQLLRMHKVGGKLLSSIRSKYANMDGLIKEPQMKRRENGGKILRGRERREWRLSGRFYANDLLLCD